MSGIFRLWYPFKYCLCLLDVFYSFLYSQWISPHDLSESLKVDGPSPNIWPYYYDTCKLICSRGLLISLYEQIFQTDASYMWSALRLLPQDEMWQEGNKSRKEKGNIVIRNMISWWSVMSKWYLDRMRISLKQSHFVMGKKSPKGRALVQKEQ